MSFISEDILKEIQSRADIVEIISEYVSLKKRGENYVGLCPFHSEKTPSFNVNPEKQLFYCFGCGVGGNVFTFLMKKENLNFPEAIRLLADKYRIPLNSAKDDNLNRDFQERREHFRLNKLVAGFYHHILLNTREGKRGLEYLKKRGILPETIEKFQLGYAMPLWDSLIKYARYQGVDMSLLEKSGLIIQRRDKKGYYDRFRDRIIFPIEDATKNIIGFGGRIIGPGEPKYLNSPDTPVFSKGENLYALSMIKRDPELDAIVVEGYMDCISLHQSGFTQAVASLGTALTQKQARLLKKYTDGAILAYDADSAGQAATLRGMDILVKEGLNVRILTLPQGKDPDEFVRMKGKEVFKEQLSKAQDVISFKLNLAKKDLDFQNPEQRLRFIKRAIKILSQIDDEVEVDIYTQKISSELNVSAQAIKDEIKKLHFPYNGLKYKKSQIRDNNKEFNKILPLNGAYKAERMVIKLLIEDKEARKKVLKELVPSNFINEKTRKIAQILYEMVQKNEPMTAESIFNYLDGDTSSELSGILMINPEFHDDDMLDSLIKKVKVNFLKHAIRQVREQIKKAEIIGEREETINLLSTYQKLKSEMDELKAELTSEKGGV